MDIAQKRKICAAVLLSTQYLLKDLLIPDDSYILEDEGEERALRQTPVRIENYVENVIPHLTETQFQSHFRINRRTYNTLLGLLNNVIKKKSVLGRPTVNLEKQLLSVLWLLATPDSYR